MAKDDATIVLGILYYSVVMTCWSFSTYGAFIIIGNFVLIPSAILYTVFFASTEGGISASVGFGFGIAGWTLGVIGVLINISVGMPNPDIPFTDIPFVVLAFYIAAAVLGTFLFMRRHKWETPPLFCPRCNRTTRYIAKYKKHFCDQCQKYIDIVER